MPASVFSVQIFSTVQSYPWNTVFFPDRVLLEVIQNEYEEFSSVDRAAAIAELAVRYYLSRDDRYRSAVEEEIGKERFCDFLFRCALCSQGKARVEDLRRTLADCPNDIVAERLCFRFHRLLSADGVIPVFGGQDGEGFLLPFSFVGVVAPEETPIVFDADDLPVEAWSAAMRHLPPPLPDPVGANVRDRRIDANIRVDAHLGSAAGWLPPVGNSLLLPVVAAWWRKEGCLPPYDPLRLMFTGAFRGGAIECVRTDAKEAKVEACVKDGILFHPVSANVPDETQVREGATIVEVFKAIQVQAETVADAAPEYASARLADYECEVRQDRFEDWDAILRRLDHLRSNLDPDFDEDAWLLSLLLTSAANCHAGRTPEAAEWNARAIAFARNNSRFEPLLLHALVEQLVILQDSEDFDGVLSLAPGLGDRIGNLLGGPISATSCSAAISESALDLAMRFHGTMGQFHAYAEISGVRPDICSRDSTSHHLETAFACAKELHRRAATPQRKLIRAKDVAKDANYLVLCAALFDHEGLNERLARSLRLSERCENAKGGNVLFALRYHAFGLYRAVLAGEEVTEADVDPHRAFIDKPEVKWWAPATTAKYLGAVLASTAAPGGAEAEKAATLFQMAAAALPLDSTDVLRKIAMTVRAEAYRSLRRLFPDIAAQCLSEARQMIDGVPDRGGRWRAWLENPDSASFPGLSYWY